MLDRELKVVNIGLDLFTKAFSDTGTRYISLEWEPPVIDETLEKKLIKFKNSRKIADANIKAFECINESVPVLTTVMQAKEVFEYLSPQTIYHAGPPIEWHAMCGPVKGAVMGACVYEGWADSIEEAGRLCDKGGIDLSPCHHNGAVGPMAGVLSPSMYVWVVKNTTYGNTAYCSLNEGLGKVLRFGAYGEDVITRLKWMEKVLGPNLRKALEASEDGINVSNITAQALLMGDECHNRNVAATNLLLRDLTGLLLKTVADTSLISELTGFIGSNPHFFLNLSMAACKSVADTILGLKNSSIVSAMARNGTEIGIRVAGCGNKWFTAKAGIPKGLFFPGYSQDDANPDLGDSTISEVVGIGGFAMAAAPAIVKFVGGTSSDALKYTREMALITHGNHSRYQIPQMDFCGTPTGIDVLKVLDTGIAPFINTGIAHRSPGIGQIGAGILRAPVECFIKALESMEIV
ncbi:MAG: DUF1116 domain-containing protein [Elusimicrobiota bacterium]